MICDGSSRYELRVESCEEVGLSIDHWYVRAEIRPANRGFRPRLARCLMVFLACSLFLENIHARRGIFITGSSLVGAAIRTPRITSKNLISVIFCEAVAIYGVIVAIIMQQKLEPSSEPYSSREYHGAFATFGAGLTVGFANLVCG